MKIAAQTAIEAGEFQEKQQQGTLVSVRSKLGLSGARIDSSPNHVVIDD
uniref:Uncharacterized protein n=1 Tax=Candidatus Nitrotoga fabula TaxID=2182327 RepID=A0A2X0QSI9_9PROT|nr:protein of unknown function [Candidatus Nitrotoga fabula]